jgi:hypothetical protein
VGDPGSEPTRLHTDLQQLAKRFINPELVGLEEGGHIVKSLRERDCPLPFRRKKFMVTTSSKMNRNEIEEEQSICLALLNHSQRNWFHISLSRLLQAFTTPYTKT